MNEISLDKKYELFIETLNQCGEFLLNAKNEDIEYYLFEEFDSNSISFLSKEMLNILLTSNLINAEIYDKSLLLAQKFRDIEGTYLWNINAVKNSKEWKEILKLSDQIKVLINSKSNKE